MRVALATVAVIALAACSGGSGSAPPTTLPGDLVPPSAVDATVMLTLAGHAQPVPHDAVAKAVPFLVRRVFEPKEPLKSYGLDPAPATVAFAMPDGSTITLSIGALEFDGSAFYVQRSGDGRVWIVLKESIEALGVQLTG